MLFLGSLSLLLVAFNGAHAEDGASLPDNVVRSIVQELGAKAATHPDVPGLSVAVLRKGSDVPVSAAFGVACIENSTPMTTRSLFKIGSVTKVFTAALIHRLIEEGKLDYTTPISRFFPDFPNGAAITVRNLLEHTSGMADMLRLEAVRNNYTFSWPSEKLIEMVSEQPAQFQPGAKQMYCNTGYLMLAVIAEKLSGLPYDEQVRRMFVDGLGMKSLVGGRDGAVVPRLSCGYASMDGQMCLPYAASISTAKGTGNLEAEPQDIVRLVNLGRVLKNNVFETLPLAPLVLENGDEALIKAKYSHYQISELDGCSLFIFDSPKITLIGKLGSFPGFGMAYFYDRQTKYAVAVSVNNERAIPQAVALGAEILHALRGKCRADQN